LDPYQAYNYYLSLNQISEKDNSTFNQVCALSSFGSLIWGWLYRKEFLSHPLIDEYNNFNANNEMAQISITQPYIETIDSICRLHHIQLLKVVIPDRNKADNKNTGISNESIVLPRAVEVSVGLWGQVHPEKSHETQMVELLSFIILIQTGMVFERFEEEGESDASEE